MITLIIDDNRVQGPSGQSVLQFCLRNGIYIPHLCFIEKATEPAASCRLCFVAIDGRDEPVCACTIPAISELKIYTDTPQVRQLQRAALRYLLSSHPLDCRHCQANRACALQNIARFLKIALKSKPLPVIPRDMTVDRSHPNIDLYPFRCVLCGQCVTACRNTAGQSLFALTGRGIDTRVHYYPGFGHDLPDCRTCRACIAICPVGALQMRHPSVDPENS